MPKIYSVFLALSVCFFYCTVNDVNAQVVTPGLKTYNAKYVSFPPTIDGIVNDSAWSQGYWESNFEDIEAGARPIMQLPRKPLFQGYTGGFISETLLIRAFG